MNQLHNAAHVMMHAYARQLHVLVHRCMTQAAMLRRKEPIIAVGGGVCLDVAGLVANLYRRNTPVIKV